MIPGRHLLLVSGIAFLIAACGGKEVPIVPTPQEMEQPPVQQAEPPLAQDPSSSSRTPQDAYSNVEERERNLAVGSMQRKFGGQPPMTRAEFVQQDVHFAYDSFTLSEEAKQLLERKASWLAIHPDVRVQIEGHCDERGTIAYNLALGERRANTVKQYMLALGIESTRLSTISYGEELPLTEGKTESDWAQNRRAHFAIQ